jgi:hypothetical protein
MGDHDIAVMAAVLDAVRALQLAGVPITTPTKRMGANVLLAFEVADLTIRVIRQGGRMNNGRP